MAGHVRRPGQPPSAEYLATRERLGFPSLPGIIERPCEWCDADPFRPCRVRATGRTLARPHHARQAAS